MVCSLCEETLLAGEIRDRDGTTFVIWQCPHFHEVLPEVKRKEVCLLGNLRARLKSYWQTPMHC